MFCWIEENIRITFIKWAVFLSWIRSNWQKKIKRGRIIFYNIPIIFVNEMYEKVTKIDWNLLFNENLVYYIIDMRKAQLARACANTTAVWVWFSYGGVIPVVDRVRISPVFCGILPFPEFFHHFPFFIVSFLILSFHHTFTLFLLGKIECLASFYILWLIRLLEDNYDLFTGAVIMRSDKGRLDRGWLTQSLLLRDWLIRAIWYLKDMYEMLEGGILILLWHRGQSWHNSFDRWGYYNRQVRHRP